MDVREVSFCFSILGFSVVFGISVIFEDIFNKIEDLRFECSFDFGGKDFVISLDMDEIIYGVY